MDELKETVETLIELDEPEALLRTLRKAAGKQKGKRWQALTRVLGDAEYALDHMLNKGQTFTKPAEPKPEVADEADPA